MSQNILEIYQGEYIEFTDQSVGDIVSYNWSFPGGSPTGSNGTGPGVYYNNIGTFSVSLTLTDNYGVTRTTLKPDIIKVSAAPWGVSFEISPSGRPSFFGEEIYFNNTSLGSPNYTEWIFPSGGNIPSGVTFGSKVSLGPLRYQDWETLTGSHVGDPGSVFSGDVTLNARSSFAIGSDSNLLEIKKLGPVEYYEASHSYLIGETGSGFIDSSPRGKFDNDPLTYPGHTGIGLSFDFLRDGSPTSGDFYFPLEYEGESVIKVDLNGSFDTNWDVPSPGQIGPYYPHVNTEKVSLYGRAYPVFNVIDSKYVATLLEIRAGLLLDNITDSPGPNITQGFYTSPDISNAPSNTVTNPDFMLILDNYSGGIPGQKSYFGLFSKKGLPKGSIDELFKHPEFLKSPDDAYLPTLGLGTSLDLILGEDGYFPGGLSQYVDTNQIATLIYGGTGAAPFSSMGKYPGVPSQYALNPNATLTNQAPSSAVSSSQFPLGIMVDVYYSPLTSDDDFVQFPVLFGLPDNAAISRLGIPIPESISPENNPTGVLVANAYGNNMDPKTSAQQRGWITIDDTPAGLGVVGYFNAYKDQYLGIAGKNPRGIVASADYYMTSPSPYSDNSIGSTGSDSSLAHPGLKIEVKDPSIYAVRIYEFYSLSSPLTDNNGQSYFSNVNQAFIKAPMTWDYGNFLEGQPAPGYGDGLLFSNDGRFFPPYSQGSPVFGSGSGSSSAVLLPPSTAGTNVDFDNRGNFASPRNSTYLGISSVIRPLSYGPFGQAGKYDSGNGNLDTSGIKFGGEII